MRIVQAGPEDVDSASILFNEYRVFYKRDPDLPACQAFLADRIVNRESLVYLAYSDETDAPVGFMQLYPSYSSVGLGSIWVLNDLFVAPSARRMGVGRALIERAEELAKGTGAIFLTLITAETNVGAQALYEEMGFVHDTVFRRYVLKVTR